MVLGSVAYNSEQSKAVGASQSISSLTELTSLSHNDVFPITELNGLTTKKVKWGTATSTLKVINDALYSPIIGSASITTLGTITTGTWNADTLTVSKGGTGSTSLIAYQLLAGNGTGAVTTFGNGTAGYILTSNGEGALPSFQNVGVTTANNNTWTGTNTFNATTTFSGATFGANVYVQYLASTTINGATTPIAVFVATSTNAIWKTDASQATTSDFLGFAVSNGINGASTTVQIDGVVNGLSGLTKGQAYYASTSGVLSSVYNIGTAELYVGTAVSPTQLLLDRKNDNWQYLGSATCNSGSNNTTQTCDIAPVSSFARFAIVTAAQTGQITCNSGSAGSAGGQVTIAKYGVTSQTIYIGWSCSSSSNTPVGGFSSTISWTSTSSIRVSNSGGGLNMSPQNQTAYFYR